MVQGKCSKKFPKQFRDSTILDQSGYPLYRRRNTGKTFKKTPNGFVFDNRWVVGYNKFTSKKYSAHINVEICSGISAVKYLYKYITKGNDRSTATLNEIDQYVDARYISQQECFWRIVEFETQRHFPAVETLALHLENQQFVLYRNNVNVNELIDAPAQTHLTKWFEINSTDIHARQYTYLDFIHHYTWSNKKWNKRKTGGSKIMARIRTASPREGDVFYLRILLHHVCGATSFSDMRKVNGVEFSTFKEACIERGLLADDHEWFECLQEGSSFKIPKNLRILFATILTHCEPANPLQLWLKFKNDLCEDFLYERRQLISNAVLNSSDENKALIEIENYLKQNNMSLSHFKDMPLPDVQQLITNRLIDEETLYDVNVENDKIKEKIPLMNVAQKHIYDLIMKTIDNKKSDIFFIDGPGGTGKSFLFNTILNKIRSEGKIAIAVASSGIAQEIK